VKTLRIAAWTACCLLAAQTPVSAPAIDSGRFLAHVQYLASEPLKGRGNGTPELEAAARYIARQFCAQGLAPAWGASYLQPFEVRVCPEVGVANRLRWRDGANHGELQVGTGFQPLNFSSSAHVSGGLVFAGYGITAPEYGYDDYAGIDVARRLVIVLRHEPREFSEQTAFAGRTYTVHSQLPWKAANARAHGAAAVLYVNDTPNHPGAGDDFESFGRNVAPGGAGIPFVQVQAEVVERWLSASGRSLKDLTAAIDRDLKPHSFALPSAFEVELETEIRGRPQPVYNVAAYRKGTTSEYVIIGAHYDHIGYGEQFSMESSAVGKVHYGADDNASGTAGLIELGRTLAAGPALKRGFLLLAFAGEELGLLGSSHWVRNPGVPLEKAIAMINLDMIGRIRGRRIQVCGGPGESIRKTLKLLSARYGFHLEYAEPPGYSASDHSAFAARPMPAILFFSGLHADYHTPGDTWDKIDAAASAQLLEMTADLARRLAAARRPGEPD